MIEQVFKATTGRIIRCSFWIWFSIVLQIAGNIIFAPYFLKQENYASIIIANLAYGFFFVVPAISIHRNYLKYSKNKELIISEENIVLKDIKDSSFISFPISAITQMDVYNTIYGKLGHGNILTPWENFEYVVFKKYGGERMIIPFYIVKLEKILAEIEPLLKMKSKNLDFHFKRYPKIETTNKD